MAITDATLVYIALLVVNYLIIWKHKGKDGDPYIGHLLGDISFIILGFAGLIITGVNLPWSWLISIIAGIHLLLTIADT